MVPSSSMPPSISSSVRVLASKVWCMAPIVGVLLVGDREISTKVPKLVVVETFVFTCCFSFLTLVVVFEQHCQIPNCSCCAFADVLGFF